MAVVYAGWHEQLERPVALKVLASHLAGDEQFRTRFLREARIASKLHHPNLVRTYDIAELDGSPCIVMELLTGGTLEGARADPRRGRGGRSGLAHAHARGVVHRDLKPANLLRAADGDVKIADFGIARAVEETRVTQIGTVLGTLRYLAPEQAEGREVGPEADVYSLGVVLDELLASPSRADRALIERACNRTRATGRRRARSPPRWRREHGRRRRRACSTPADCRARRGAARRCWWWSLHSRRRRGVAAIAVARRGGHSGSSRCRTRQRPRSRRATSSAWLDANSRKRRQPATESEPASCRR